MLFKCFNEWNLLPETANKLFSRAEQDSLFFSRLWFENLANTALKPDQKLFLACVVDDKKVLAVLPLISSKNKQWTSLSHIYSSLYTVLLTETHKNEILHCLANGLSTLSFESLTLGPLAADDINMNSLELALESTGVSCNRYAQFFNWFHPLLPNQTFSKYMQARPSKVRNTIARKQRKLIREQDYQIRLLTGDEVSNAMADYHTVYKASWKKKELFTDTLEGFVSHFSTLQWTRLAILYINKQPVAAQIWFVTHKKASIFKLAYDEAWKKYSPGSLLTQYLMEYVIEVDNVEEIDYLTGNDRYKQDWMSQRRQRWNLVCTHKLKPKKQENIFKQLLQHLINLKKDKSI
jgi:frataxin-like iron-binding protein CyaY